MIRFLSLAFVCASALGCGESFQADPVDAPPADAASLADAGTPDAGPTRDSGPDAGPLRCTAEPLADRVGEGCFCDGPAVFHEGHLYRQSIGIQVYRAAGETLEPLGVVEERASASGGLAIAAGHLVSIVDFVEDPLRVYALDDPATPREVGRLVLPFEAHSAIAAHGARVAVGERGEPGRGTIALLDLGDPAAPTLERTVEVGGSVAALAAGAEGVAALVERGRSPDRSLWLVWLAGHPSEPIERVLDARTFGRGLAFVDPDTVLVSGGDEHLVQRFRLEAGGIIPAGSLTHGADFFAGSGILVRGDRAVIGWPPTVVAIEPALARLTLGEPTGGDGWLAAPPGPLDIVYASDGNGVVPWRVRCE